MADEKKTPVNPNPGWTCEDINQNGLIVFVLATFAVWVLSGFLMAYFHNSYLHTELESAGDVPEISKNIASYNGADRLQPDPPAEIEAMAASQQAMINSYGWVNHAEGKVRVPIKEAMAAKLDQGFVRSADVLYDSVDGKLVIKPIKLQMRFDKPSYTVKAGEELNIVFVNDDLQQHNLMISVPGSAEEVGNAGDKAMVADAAKFVADGYMPQSKKILHKMELINPGATGELSITAPSEPGEYVIICTFPGHWRTMNSILKVIN